MLLRHTEAIEILELLSGVETAKLILQVTVR